MQILGLPGCRVVHPVEAVGVGMVESRLAVGAVDRWVDRIFIRCTGRSPDRHRPPAAEESLHATSISPKAICRLGCERSVK